MQLEISEKIPQPQYLGKVYIDTRFDILENSFMQNPQDILIILEFLSQYGRVLKSTYGLEVAWKTKKLHCHWRAELQLISDRKAIPKGSIGQTFKYYLTKRKLSLSKYYFKTIIPKKDLETFFQYTLKDQETYDDVEQDLQFGWSENEILELWIRSRESRRIALELFTKHETRKNNEILEYDKLKSFIDNHRLEHILIEYQNEVDHRFSEDSYHGHISTNYQLQSFRVLQAHLGTLIVQYYIDNHDGKIPYGNKIISLFNRYCIHSKILTAKDLTAIIFKF